MTVDRVANQDADTEAVMSIHFAPADFTHHTSDSATSSPAPTDSTTSHTQPSDHDPTDRVETINMKNRTNAEILQDLVKLTKSYPIEPTEEEKEQLRSLEQQRIRSERDRKQVLEYRARVAREKQILEQGRNDLAAQAV
jgi:large subunit ribosomal protein MRP49